MEKNQNDKSNQQPDSKSHLEQTQDGKKRQEINPNNPKATENNQQGSQKRSDSTSTENKTTTVVKDTEEQAEETTSEKAESQPTVNL
jgi:hypothetical protein